jgi:prepilin peptidase CpaA
MTSLVCLLLLAVILDLKSYKISNYLILTGVFSGIFFQYYECGWAGISLCFLGIIVPILLLFPLFIIKALGAGDIKLFSVIGSYMGIFYVFKSIAAAFIIGAVISLIYLLRYGQVFRRFHYLFCYIQTVISNFTDQGINREAIKPYYDRKRDGYKGIIHFSIPILGAVILQVIFGIY